MAVRYADCTRRQHRNREASETRYAQTADASLSDFGTGDVSPSNGISLQRQRPLQKQRQPQRQPQRRNAQRQLQLQLSLRGTSKATATVAARNVKGNGNCRCAELKATATARCAEMANATEPIAMLTGVVGTAHGRTRISTLPAPKKCACKRGGRKLCIHIRCTLSNRY